MYKFGDKEFSDDEMTEGLWERLKAVKEECHSLAVEYVDSHPRRKYYALHYQVDPGMKKVYACFTDEELNIIKQVYDDVEKVNIEEPFTDEEDRMDYIHDCFLYVDVDFLSYIPEHDLHWAGGDPDICKVDLEDWNMYCVFQIVSMNSSSESPEINDLSIAMTDDEYVKLLELCIFDPELTFHDLKSLMPELYERGQRLLDVNHLDSFIRLGKITGVAGELREKKMQHSIEKLIDNPFIGFAIQNMLRNKEHYVDDDPELWQSFLVII